MLSKRQKYDYRDIDPTELKLIKVGHAIWGLYKQERRSSSGTDVERMALLEACETVWAIKKAYRIELAAKRKAKFSRNRHRFAPKAAA